MKKSIFSIGSALCLASVLFFSCKKETNNVTTTSPAQHAKVMTVTNPVYAPENANNPYDYIGKLHNEALDETIGNTENESAFNSSWLNYTGNFLSNQNFSKDNYTTIMTNAQANATLGTFDPSQITELTSAQLNAWSNANVISADLKDFYTSINSYIETLSKDGDYRAFKTSMVQLEATTGNFSTQDQVMALSSAAIARYSFSYWLDNNNTGGIAMPMSWGKADFAGACGGAVRATVVGLFGGPVGWGAWAGSVLGGAAAASIMSVL